MRLNLFPMQGHFSSLLYGYRVHVELFQPKYFSCDGCNSVVQLNLLPFFPWGTEHAPDMDLQVMLIILLQLFTDALTERQILATLTSPSVIQWNKCMSKCAATQCRWLCWWSWSLWQHFSTVWPPSKWLPIECTTFDQSPGQKKCTL